jgi:hypothetical protein
MRARSSGENLRAMIAEARSFERRGAFEERLRKLSACAQAVTSVHWDESVGIRRCAPSNSDEFDMHPESALCVYQYGDA